MRTASRNEFQARLLPDGATVAFARPAGWSDSQWWRYGHSHLDESEIWLRKEGAPATYEKIVDLNGRNALADVDARWATSTSCRTGAGRRISGA